MGIWLDHGRGHLVDWLTQRWVQLTGERVDLVEEPWLDGPAGTPEGIGADFFDRFAIARGWTVQRNGPNAGLMASFGQLASPAFDPRAVDPRVVRFYERTASFELDAWAEWCGLFRPFGRLLAWIFSKRLQQLNVPLSALDTSRGMTSEVVQLVAPETGSVQLTAWIRRLLGTGSVLYAGSYSICRIPGFGGPCVRVVFPLPNGNAIVVMRPQAHADGSFSIVSAGQSFGDPGFYFTVHRDGVVWATYVRPMKESIHVYGGQGSEIRADHVLTFAGATFLRLHYRLRERAPQGSPWAAPMTR